MLNMSFAKVMPGFDLSLIMFTLSLVGLYDQKFEKGSLLETMLNLRGGCESVLRLTSNFCQFIFNIQSWQPSILTSTTYHVAAT